MRSFLVVAGVLALAGVAHATTYKVGPKEEHTELDKTLGRALMPGDIVEVEGDHTYQPIDLDGNSGTPEAPIIIRGIKKNGKRPRVSGGDYTIQLEMDNYTLEGFEVTDGNVCILHQGNNLVVRDTVVHDCPTDGLLSVDYDSGSLTVEYSEFYRNGDTEKHHQLYVYTDTTKWPDSYFRLAHCYIHDGGGGNNVKTRAARNEIYYNWIQGAAFHELDLVESGDPHPNGNSDVVGNVLIKYPDSQWFISRFGGDGDGGTDGHYRFVNNTMVCGTAAVCLRAQDHIDSVELWNNVMYFPTIGEGQRLFSDSDAVWTSGSRVLVGGGNWVSTGVELPDELMTGNVVGADPGFVDAAGLDLRPAAGSMLVDGSVTPMEPAGHEFLPTPLAAPANLPPWGIMQAIDAEQARTTSGAALDIGALEVDSPAPTSPPGQLEPADSSGGGCGCSVGNRTVARGWIVLVGLAIAAVLGRRRR